MLREIIEQCRRNEERLRTLARRTRRQRKKVERFLEQAKQQQRVKPRVRFQLETKDGPDELSDLANRCEGLLSQLRIHRHQQGIKPSLDDVQKKSLRQHELLRSTD